MVLLTKKSLLRCLNSEIRGGWRGYLRESLTLQLPLRLTTMMDGLDFDSEKELR